MRTHQHHPQARVHGKRADDPRRAELLDVLNELARALTTGDGRAAAALWDAPAFIIGSDTVLAAESRDKLVPMFAGARAQYTAHGVVDTRPDIQHADWIAHNLVVVTVRWPYLDAMGREVGAEASDYTLRRDPTGKLKLRIAVMRGVEPGTH
jgi:hypothetical protein